MRSLVVTVAPTKEPVTKDELKLLAKEETGTTGLEDDLLDIFISSARRTVEGKIRRALVPRTMRMVLDDFPGSDGEIELPMPPLQSVTSVSYTDGDGDTVTLVEDTDYELATDSFPGVIRPCYGQDWPTDVRKHPGSVTIVYVTGYPLDAEDAPTAPDPAKLWIMRNALTHYEHRKNLVTGTIVSPLPESFFDGLLDSIWTPR